MSRYSIENSKSELENIDICLGYDEGLEGFWLYIQDMNLSEEEDHYIFSNILHVEGFKMTLEQIENILRSHGYELPNDIALQMIQDATDAGYPNTLNEKERTKFLDFIKQVS